MKVTRGVPYPLGVVRDGDGVNIAYVCEQADCGVVLYERSSLKELDRIPFEEEFALGNIHCMHISGVDAERAAYCFYEGDSLVPDVRGRAFLGGYRYGVPLGENVRPALFPAGDYDWEGDRNPRIPYEDSICYCLHVRGFTRHSSSGVNGRGTFLGLTEKIPYLKELGITTLELQPAYEFPEAEKKSSGESPYVDEKKPAKTKLNYWGYTEGYYYSPKNSYAASKDAATEFKDMVKALHANGMEVIMQFYFTEATSEQEIPEILRYWVMEYHVDGFHLKGANINAGILMEDPALAGSKLWYYSFPEKKTEEGAGEDGRMRRLAEYGDDYRYDMRRFLKGDEGMLPSVMYHLRRNPSRCGRINYLTNYDGFTLMDLFSYDRKHNEANGEDNKDGNDYNASWNCGQEGRTRRKTVAALRLRQIKNALLLLFLSQGTPLLFMGDEFGNSQEGNNNPYCQDSTVTWLNWKNLESGREIYEFTEALIRLRREHPVFRQKKELRLMDYGACGYPDASYHGEVPWKPDTASYSRQLGVMYCGRYAYTGKRLPDDFFYVAYNMHWETHTFALPRLPKGLCWELCAASGKEAGQPAQNRQEISVTGRCICVYRSAQEKEKAKDRKEKEAADEGVEAF